jgi:hypothetical protein
MTTITIPTARKTAKTARGEFGGLRPIYEGGRTDDRDGRVRLEDGTLCYVSASICDPLPVLCTALDAVDAGDNTIRSRKAQDGASGGLARPVFPATGITLTLIPPEAAIIGYYREVETPAEFRPLSPVGPAQR